MVQESKSFDIVELSTAFKEMRREVGVTGGSLAIEAMRDCRNAFDDTTLPWMKGNGDLTLISLKDYKMKNIPHFYAGKSKSNELIPLLGICSTNGEKAFGVSILQDTVRLSYAEKPDSIKNKDFKTIFPRCKLYLISRNNHGLRKNFR